MDTGASWSVALLNLAANLLPNILARDNIWQHHRQEWVTACRTGCSNNGFGKLEQDGGQCTLKAEIVGSSLIRVAILWA